jgi:hypothetical protein
MHSSGLYWGGGQSQILALDSIDHKRPWNADCVWTCSVWCVLLVRVRYLLVVVAMQASVIATHGISSGRDGEVRAVQHTSWLANSSSPLSLSVSLHENMLSTGRSLERGPLRYSTHRNVGYARSTLRPTGPSLACTLVDA